MKLIVKDIIEGFSEFSDCIKAISVGLEEEPDVKFNCPLQVKVEITREGSTFYLKGEVKTTIELECARCLNPAMTESISNFEGIFTWKQTSAPFLEISASSDMHKFGGPELDLSPLIRESVLMSIPIAPLCREDCAGLCPKCGADLNLEKCKCDLTVTDPRWNGLKGILNN